MVYVCSLKEGMVITIEPGMFFPTPLLLYSLKIFQRHLCPAYSQISETISQHRDQDRGELHHSIFIASSLLPHPN